MHDLIHSVRLCMINFRTFASLELIPLHGNKNNPRTNICLTHLKWSNNLTIVCIIILLACNLPWERRPYCKLSWPRSRTKQSLHASAFAIANSLRSHWPLIVSHRTGISFQNVLCVLLINDSFMTIVVNYFSSWLIVSWENTLFVLFLNFVLETGYDRRPWIVAASIQWMWIACCYSEYWRGEMK